MQKEAVAFYDQLLEDEDLASASFRVLHDGLEHKKLIFDGPSALAISSTSFHYQTDWTRVKVSCEIIWSALQKVKNAAVKNDEILDELGITDVEKELVKIDPGYRQVSRPPRLVSISFLD
jgi:hypothetical protein